MIDARSVQRAESRLDQPPDETLEMMMCLAIPMVLMERDEHEGVVEIDGVSRRVSLMLLPDASVGEHLLIHAGFAIARIDAEAARSTLELLRTYADSMEAL